VEPPCTDGVSNHVRVTLLVVLLGGCVPTRHPRKPDSTDSLECIADSPAGKVEITYGFEAHARETRYSLNIWWGPPSLSEPFPAWGFRPDGLDFILQSIVIAADQPETSANCFLLDHSYFASVDWRCTMTDGRVETGHRGYETSECSNSESYHRAFSLYVVGKAAAEQIDYSLGERALGRRYARDAWVDADRHR